MGLSLATSTLVGQNIGAGRLDRAIRTNATSCLISFVTLVTAGLVFFFTGRQLAQFLMPEGGPAIDVTATFISILSISFGFIGLQQVLTGTLRGAGDTVAPMLLAIVSLWILRFPLAYVLSKHTSLRRDGNLVGRGNFDLRLGTSHRCLVPARQLETPPIAGGS